MLHFAHMLIAKLKVSDNWNFRKEFLSINLGSGLLEDITATNLEKLVLSGFLPVRF